MTLEEKKTPVVQDAAAESDPSQAVQDAATDPVESDAVEEDQATTADPVNDIGAPTREGMKRYVLRVASNKEEKICEALERKVKIEALEDHVARILLPTVKEKRIKGGKAKVVERKLFPGYVFVEMATEPDGSIPEHVWFMVKETMGVGDFIGSDGKPTPMEEHDADKVLEAAQRSAAGEADAAVPYSKGDRVKIREGAFENFEGDVDSIDEKSGIVTVLVTIFGRATPVDVEYWQLERV